MPVALGLKSRDRRAETPERVEVPGGLVKQANEDGTGFSTSRAGLRPSSSFTSFPPNAAHSSTV